MRAPSPVFGITIWLLALILVLAAAFGMTVVAALFAVAAGLSGEQAMRLLSDPGASPLVTSPGWIVATIVANELAVVSAFLLGVRRLGLKLRELFLPWGVKRGTLAASVLLVFGLAPLAQFCADFTGLVTERQSVSEELVRTLGVETNFAGFFIGVLLLGLVPGVCEEALFRGLLMRCFERWGSVANLLVTSALFALLHLEPTQVAGTFVLGLGFGLVRFKTGSVVPCMVAHAVYNAAVVGAARFTPELGVRLVHPLGIAAGLVVFGSALAWLSRSARRGVSGV